MGIYRGSACSEAKSKEYPEHD